MGSAVTLERLVWSYHEGRIATHEFVVDMVRLADAIDVQTVMASLPPHLFDDVDRFVR